MDNFKLGLQSLVPQPSSGRSSVNSSMVPDQTLVLAPRAPRGMVSTWTCCKISVTTFVVGVVVGFMLERRFKRWVRKLLKRFE